MTEQSAPGVPAPSAARADLPFTPESRPGGIAPWLYGLGFLLLAAAIFYLWEFPNTPVEAVASSPDIRVAEQKIEATEQTLESLEARVAHLEQQPKPVTAADLGKITTQLDALGARSSDQGRLVSRVDELSGRMESLSGLSRTGIDTIKQQLDSTATRLATVEKASEGLEAISGRVDRLARIQAAALALANGQPLGDLPGAPPALSRYAHSAPPTMAHLRLMFPKVEQETLATGEPGSANSPLVERIWERAQGLVTVRQGDDVVVGNTSAMALGHARVALDVGDLATAVGEMTHLNQSASRVVAGWLAEARALMDARSALTDMASHA